MGLFARPTSSGDRSVTKGLQETGYVEGQNVAIEYRWDEDHLDRLPALAVDLVSHSVDVIIAISGTPGALAAKHATSTIPIVFVNVGDPVGVGLVASLARPGGNLTGFVGITIDLVSKLLDLLTDLVPQASAIALLVNPNNAITELIYPNMQEAARARGSAHCSESRHRKRDRIRLRFDRPTASQRARRRGRSFLCEGAS